MEKEEIEEYFNKLCCDLVIRKEEKYPEYVFYDYFHNGEYETMFELRDDGLLVVNQYQVWDEISKYLNLDWGQTQLFIKNGFEKYFGLTKCYPISGYDLFFKKWRSQDLTYVYIKPNLLARLKNCYKLIVAKINGIDLKYIETQTYHKDGKMIVTYEFSEP